jgi:hypothetical protein
MSATITTPTDVKLNRRAVVDGLADRNRVRELAVYLGLDSDSVAEGLLEAVRRDVTRFNGGYRVHRAA